MAVVDAANRVLIPGFVDTHSHSYQGLLRSSLPNGRVDPDYNRDVQNSLTPAYAPADVHAGVLITALSFIEMGTTTIVDLSQISHTPEHTDACIQAFKDAGLRTVFAYSRGEPPGSRYPQDVGRLQRTYFSSRDQLLTSAEDKATHRAVYAAIEQHKPVEAMDAMRQHLHFSAELWQAVISLGTVTQPGLLSAARRVFGPALSDGARYVDRLLGGRVAVRRRLDALGSDSTVEDFRVEQVVWAGSACSAPRSWPRPARCWPRR